MARGSVHAREVGLAHDKNYSITNLKLPIGALKSDLTMYEKSKMKYLQIHKFPFKNVIFLAIDQNILENSSKTWLLPGLVAFPNGSSAPIGRVENFANFKFLEGQICNKSLPLSTKRKLTILLDPFPTASFSGVFFNLEKINTGLVNHRMSYLTFASLLRSFI